MLSLSTSGWILHLDVDSFFAGIEQRDQPALRGRPVAVGTGVVASCSAEAKRQGVQTGMALTEARRLCRSLVVVPGDYRKYEQAGRRIQAICLDHTALIEMPALDDLYLDVSAAARSRADPGRWCEDLARRLRKQIDDEVRLSVSIGIGGNKLAARVATQQAKQRRSGRPLPALDPATFHSPEPGIVRVLPGCERAYLAPWPVEVLPGVGHRTLAKLDQLNIRRVAELADMPHDVFMGIFGRRGRALRDLAHGVDRRAVEPQRARQSVSRRTSFDPPVGKIPFLRAMLCHLVERAACWLRMHDLATRGLAVSIRYGDYQGAEGRASFRQATSDETVLKKSACDRFERLYTRRLPLRLIGVEFSPLQPADPQGELFPDDEVQRAVRLDACKDAIRKRFGFMAVLPGSALVLTEELSHDRDNFRLRTPCLTR